MFLVWGNSQEIAAIIDQGTISIWGEETTKGDMWKTWVEEGEIGDGGMVIEGLHRYHGTPIPPSRHHHEGFYPHRTLLSILP